MQFACFQNESKVNKYLSFICLIGFLSTLQVASLSSTGTTSCFLPNIPQATHCCLSLEIKRKKMFPEYDQRLFLPIAAKKTPVGRLEVLMLYFLICDWAKHFGCQTAGIFQGNADKISKFCIMSMSFLSCVQGTFSPLQNFSSC